MTNNNVVVTNLLLAALSVKKRAHIFKLCETIELHFGDVVCHANQPYQYVYFPLNGFISQIAVLGDHEPLEMGLIGNEGMLGASLALGINIAPLQAVVQGAGKVLRMPTEVFLTELRNSPSIANLIQRYIYVLMQQLAQAVTCIHFHDIELRLARWLLMSHDRAHTDEFLLTHKFLSHMLGVRRSGVSIAASKLQSKNLISYARGKIHILNRKGLETSACRCYQDMREFHTRI